jgi:RND superfamily putative drug exporter
VAAFAALVVLPFTLVLFGRWIFWPVTPRTGQPTLAESRSWWRRVGDTVARHPARFVAATVLLLAVLSLGVTRISTGLSPADQFLQKPEAIAAAERLAESFPAGASDPTVIVTADAVAPVQGVVAGVPGVASVRPAGAGEGWTRLAAVLSAPPGSASAQETVTLLRQRLEPFDQTYVGGTEAESLDAQAAAERDRQLIIPLILGLVMVALVVLLRSLVAPLILVASVVGTYLASLGASWWVFTHVLGFDRLDVGVPLLAFLFLVALGVDYNIFLVTRAAEESREHGAREGMLRGLTATGGVITSAGILLAAVFAVLGVLPLVVLAQLGVVICVGVLLDTLVVRTVLVPAVAVTLGDGFWWPRQLRQPRHRADETRSLVRSG